jgi:hypothetical protein
MRARRMPSLVPVPTMERLKARWEGEESSETRRMTMCTTQMKRADM